MDGKNLLNVTIFHLDKDFKLIEKILASEVDIENNDWALKDVNILKLDSGFFKNEDIEKFSIKSNYDHEKITSLFKNFDTLPFLDILVNYKYLLDNGYNKKLLDENLHTWLSFPFFLFMMTAIAAVLTMNTLKKSDNIKFIMIGIILCITVFYLKDLSLALGQTDRIPLILSVWSPVIALGFFSFIGVLQINENKFLIIIFLICFSISSKAENLKIEFKEITLSKANNTSIFENDVIIKTNEGKEIFSDFAEYNKKLGLIKLKETLK